MSAYRPVFDAAASDFLALLPKRRERCALLAARDLANHPFVRSDYTLADESGRPIDYILTEGFVFGYWLDHGAREVRIVEVQDAL